MIGASIAADLTPEAKDEQVMNARRENRILTAFNLDPRLHAYDLTVIVDGSSAALGGIVESRRCQGPGSAACRRNERHRARRKPHSRRFRRRAAQTRFE
jgi:hypothetical protein